MLHWKEKHEDGEEAQAEGKGVEKEGKEGAAPAAKAAEEKKGD